MQSPWLMQREIVNDKPRAGLEGRDLVAQDTDAGGVRPVVEDVAEEVDIGAADRLRGEKSVALVRDPRRKTIVPRLCGGRDTGVLYNEVRVREERTETIADGAAAPADV